MPTSPDFWEAVLLALASFRVWKLIADDEILARPRNWVMGHFGRLDSPRRGRWTLFLVCPWCAGFWIALAWWVAWLLAPDWTLWAAAPWALSAAVGLIADHLTD